MIIIIEKEIQLTKLIIKEDIVIHYLLVFLIFYRKLMIIIMKEDIQLTINDGKTHFDVPILLFFSHFSSLYFYFETLHPYTFIFI